jgi:hypothetical protein
MQFIRLNMSAAIVALLGLSSVAAAAPFADGGFETGTTHFDSTSPPSWTFGTPGGRWGNNGSGVSPAPEGVQFVALNDDGLGSISQTFDTLSGTTYVVDFRLTGIADGTPDQFSVDVTATGNTPSSYAFNTGNAAFFDLPPSILETYTFTASSSSTTLTFASTALSSSGAQFGPVIDAVTVVALPEPGSLVLFGLGAATLLGIARRQKA